MGAGIFKSILELVNSAALIYSWKKYGMKQSFLDKEGFREIFCVRAFWDYIKFFLRVSIGEYTDYLGWEMKTIICGVYGDVDIIAAWAAMAISVEGGQVLAARCETALRSGFRLCRRNPRFILRCE